MSEENENSEKEEKEENSEKEEKNEKEVEKQEKEEKEDEKEEEKENFPSYEDELITTLNKLSETIDNFNTLSKEQAENAILETDIKINNCKKILEKMEEYINNLKNEDEDKLELNKKLLNYKTEYNEIMNKYKEIQDNYINKKTENALMQENLIDDDNNRNSIRITTGTAFTNNNAKGAGNPHMIDGELDEEKNKKNNINNKKENENKKNNANLKNNEKNKGINNNTRNEISLIAVSNNNNNLGYYLSPNKEREDGFHEINRDYDQRKKVIIIICVAICIIIFFLIFLIALFS